MPLTQTNRGGPSRKRPRPAEITSYQAALRYLYSHIDLERMRVIRSVERTFKLDRMRLMLDKLGRPHEQIRTVHIAGTKGKGSTVAMLSAVLRGCGLTVGEFTSPHLVDVRERVTTNGRPISQADFTARMRTVAERVEEFEDEQPHFFELMTALAMLQFAEQAVDLAIIETGLGGRLDSTNVISPEAVGITQISLDHMHILGDTLEEIAGEKAGVLKRGVPAVSAPQPEEAEAVLRKRATKVGAELRFLRNEIQFSSRFEATPVLGPHTRICVGTPDSTFDHVAVPLQGEHQAFNCGLALALVDCLRGRGFDLDEETVAESLGQTRLDGRMEMIQIQPRVLIDGAHNAASIQALVRALGAHIPYDSLVVIFGCGEDKDVDGMLQAIALGADKLIFTRSKGNPRAVEPSDLQQRFAEISGKMTQTAENLDAALDLAQRAVGREDLICVTGSFYLAGEAKKRSIQAASRGSGPGGSASGTPAGGIGVVPRK